MVTDRTAAPDRIAPTEAATGPSARAWVALVGPEIEENLSLRYLVSSLSGAGLEVEILAFNVSAELPALLDDLCLAVPPPLLIGLSLAFQHRALDMLALAAGLRERGYSGHITAGGHFGSFARREVLRDFPEIDSICCYEAEGTLVELAQALAADRALSLVPGLARRDPAGAVECTPVGASVDLARLPWPDRRGEPVRCLGHPVVPLVGGRGCYANCSFCCIAAWHRQAGGEPRLRIRPVDDLADEMAWLNQQRGVDVFIFHDDNFFLPRPEASLERINALADALEARGIGRFATVVKARPNDVTTEVFTAMRARLGCVRAFLGIENDSPSGLRALHRGVSPSQNHAALALFAELELYVCFNMLIFEPDATLQSLEQNLALMEQHASSPWNFGRVELYSGTPLLARLQAEGRCRGDYLGWDYTITDPAAQRVYELAMPCFVPRNFAPGALANRLMGTRFDVEMSRHFHPDRFRPEWLDRAKQLSRTLATSSIDALRHVIAFVEQHGPQAPSQPLRRDLGARLRMVETELEQQATALEQQVQGAVGAHCAHVKRPARLPRGGDYRPPSGRGTL